MSFESAINRTMKFEVGSWFTETHPAVQFNTKTNDFEFATGYVDDKDDAGGQTKYGISKNSHPDLDIYNLSWANAKHIYNREYWLRAFCDQIDTIDSKLAELHFDSAVNHGVSRANKLLQEALGVKIDGVIGVMTLGALHKSNVEDVYNKYLEARKRFVNDIVLSKPSQKKFLKGWMNRINSFVR